MILLILALIGQVKHGEIYWTTQNGPLTRVVDNTGIDVVPLLPKWVKGETKPSTEGLTTFKQVNTTPTKWGSYFIFEKEFRGTPKWTCVVGSELINAPRIFGYYEDDYVYVWGVNFQDLYGSPPKVYLVNDLVSELPLYRPVGDRQQKQGYYENPYLIRVKPPKSGHIVVYTGEMGLLGCSSIYYEKPQDKKIVLLTEDINGPLDVVSGTICRGNVSINGAVTIYPGGELHGVTIKKNQPYSVRMMDNTTLKECHIENIQDESVCVEILGRVRLEGNYFKGVRACGVKTQIEKCVVLRNTYEAINRYTTSGAYFPVGSNSAIVDNTIKNAYRGIVAQANNGPVRHNLILRNDFENGGVDIMGGEQIIFETKAIDTTTHQAKVGQTVMVNGGTGRGSFYIQTINGPDRPIKVDSTSTYSVGNIATENIFILNRVTNSRVGLSFWKYSAGNVVSGLQCTNVPWGFIQNAGAEHGYAFHNELRDSFFQSSTVNLTNTRANGHTINFKMNRVECLSSPLRAYNLDATEAGEGVFIFKCCFGLVDGFPLGLDRELPSPKLPYPALTVQGINHIVVRDCRLNGLKTNLEELCK